MENSQKELGIKLGTLFRLSRTNLGLTQREVGTALGWPEHQVMKFELGLHTGPLNKVLSLAKFFNLDVSDLLKAIELPRFRKKKDVHKDFETIALYVLDNATPEILAHATQYLQAVSSYNLNLLKHLDTITAKRECQ